MVKSLVRELNSSPHNQYPTVVFPIFLECGTLTLDPYWKKFFDSCALGRFPRGMKYLCRDDLHIITINIGKKTDEIVLPTDTKESYKLLMKLFHERFHLYSEQEGKLGDSLTIAKNKLNKALCTNDWKDVKQKKVRECMIREYVIRYAQQHNLTQFQKLQLFFTINTGIVLKAITANDIDIENGVINTIRNINFDNSLFSLSVENVKVEKNNKYKNYYLKQFKKYLTDKRKNSYTVLVSECIKDDGAKSISKDEASTELLSIPTEKTKKKRKKTDE